MRIKVLKKYNLFIAFLISILGFGSACSKDKEVSAAYGTISACYNVFGNITSEIGSRIPGIKVNMILEHPLSGNDTTIYMRDTVTTISDYYGYYDLGMRFPPIIQNFKIEFIDVDGIALREYHKKDTTVEFIDPEYENPGPWYLGKASKKLNVKLKEKE